MKNRGKVITSLISWLWSWWDRWVLLRWKSLGQLSGDASVLSVICVDFCWIVLHVFVYQSRILKHAGDLAAAAALSDEARCMDLADRYINSECVKLMLQADQVFIILLFNLNCILCFSHLNFSCMFSDTLFIFLLYLLGSFGRENCCFVHKGWGSAQQSPWYAMHVVCIWLFFIGLYSKDIVFFTNALHLSLKGMSLPRVKAISVKVILGELSKNIWRWRSIMLISLKINLISIHIA